MDPLFQDERISAYLDGELPPDERSQFEDELARNGELRQIVEELRGLHDSLQALPQRRLDDDFAQHVLRRAERAMLSDSHAANGSGGSAAAKSAADVSAVEAAHAVAGANNSISDARRSRRPWIWAAVAIAAAVALMVFNPPAKKHDQVAVSDSTPHQSPSNAPLNRDNSRSEEQISTPADNGDNALRKRSESRADRKNPSDGATEVAGPEPRRALEKDSSSFAKSAVAPSAAPVENSAEVLAGKKLRQQGDVAFGQNGSASKAALSNQPSEGGPAKPQSFAGTVGGAAVAKSDAADARALAEPALGLGKGVAMRRGEAEKARSFPFDAERGAKQGVPVGDMIVAEYATTSLDTLQRLLDKRGITLNNSPAAMLTAIGAVRSVSAVDGVSDNLAFRSANTPVASDRGQAGGKSNRADRTSPQPSADSIGGLKTLAPADAPITDAEHSPQVAEAQDERLEVVYVVGTREQVMGLVDDLHAQPAEYRTLAVTAVTPGISEGREEDAKAQKDRFAVDDEAGQDAADKVAPVQARAGQGRAASVRNQAQAEAPAAPIPFSREPTAGPAVPAASPPAALLPPPTPPQDQKPAQKAGTTSSSDSGGRAGGGSLPPGATKESKDTAKQSPASKPGADAAAGAAPIVVEQRAAEPASESAVAGAVADSDSLAEPSERANGSAWAARMPLRPETENVLRQALAQRENQPAESIHQLKLQTNQTAAKGGGDLDQEKPTDKVKSTTETQQTGKADGVARRDGGTAGDQVQAVFVFRVTPKKASPTAAAPSATVPPSALPGKATK